jgi:hypothetical protein
MNAIAIRNGIAMCGGFALCVAASIVGFAQEPPRPPVPAEIFPPSSIQVDDRQIDQFADAYLVIEEIQSDAKEELSRTTDPKQENEVKASAETKIIEAVERSGLRLEQFNRISELMASDSELRAKIADRVEKRRRI